MSESANELPIMEHFYTIQGEGAHSGKSAYFIRLGGCDVGCHWCDVKESWDFDKHPKTKVEDLVNAATAHQAKLSVITGGEPLIYNMDVLTRSIQDANIKTHLETSGAYPLTGNWDWITLSPKKFKGPVDGIHQFADELKIVVYNRSDFKFAESHAELVGEHCELYLQPEWGKRESILSDIIQYVKENPKWRISIQSHKYIHVP